MITKTVKFKKLHPEATIPSYAKPGDFGADLTAVSGPSFVKGYAPNGDYAYVEYDTGIAIELPEGVAGFVFPRSSISKTSLILSNSIGLIDEGYRGPIKARFKVIKYLEDSPTLYQKGDRICQLVLVPVINGIFEETDHLSETERESGGFGSSGK